MLVKIACFAVIAATIFHFYQAYQTRVTMEKHQQQAWCNAAIAGKIKVDSNEYLPCLMARVK